MLTNKKLAELKSLHAATDQNKWTVDSCGQDDCWCRCVGIEGEPPTGRFICNSGCLSKEDAEFLVQVHNSFSDLIEEIETLRSKKKKK